MEINRPDPHIQLPENARLAFKGEIFDVYQWEQEMYDGTKALFERLKRDDSASVIPVLPDGRIILIEQQQPSTGLYLSTVAGRMEKGEDPLAAIKREMLEETGYASEDWVFWDAYQPMHKVDWACYIFIAKGVEKTQEPHLDNGEKISLKIVTFDEFIELTCKHELFAGQAFVRIAEAHANPEKKQELRKLFL